MCEFHPEEAALAADEGSRRERKFMCEFHPEEAALAADEGSHNEILLRQRTRRIRMTGATTDEISRLLRSLEMT